MSLFNLALQILNNVTITDFPSGIRFFFNKAIELVTQQNLDPAGLGGDVGSYLNTKDKIETAANKFALAFQRATKAEELGRQIYLTDAIKQWVTLFGDYFPAYG